MGGTRRRRTSLRHTLEMWVNRLSLFVAKFGSNQSLQEDITESASAREASSCGPSCSGARIQAQRWNVLSHSGDSTRVSWRVSCPSTSHSIHGILPPAPSPPSLIMPFHDFDSNDWPAADK